MKKLITGTLLAVALMALTPQCGDDWFASAQTITSDPIQTVPGYPGCGGNTTQQDVTSTITCANQRTFHFGTLTRTVVAVSTMNPDGSASVKFTLTGGVAPADIPLVVRAHTGISSGPTVSEVSGVIPKGTAGPVTLTFAYDCGQIDVKAVFTAPGNENGRISGGFFCKPFVAPTTTAPGSTTPTTSPTTPSAPSSVPSATTGGPGASVSPAKALPATGVETEALTGAAIVIAAAGAGALMVAATRRASRVR